MNGSEGKLIATVLFAPSAYQPTNLPTYSTGEANSYVAKDNGAPLAECL